MSMDKIINYLLLVIIFVFDPLAISLVVAANFAFARLNKPEDTEPESEWKDWGLLSDIGINDNFDPQSHLDEIEDQEVPEPTQEKVNDIEVKDEEYLQFPNLQENLEIQDKEPILDNKDFGGGNFRTRPPQDENIIDYN